LERFLDNLADERIEMTEDIAATFAASKPQWFLDLRKAKAASMSLT